eukprot:GFUD01022716.1.p1 GENE.GFUD01022716.1~~GFUD01022716.1.p1  ORF type:complete len:322 (+),score=81.52 GFUD01022716.1:38-1003(+)
MCTPDLRMYSCHHCEVSCENRTRFNRHMRHHMTTDVKFLETQDSSFVEPRQQESETGPKHEIKEMPDEIKFEMTNIETEFKNSVNLANDKDLSATEINETHSDLDMEDDLLETDFMDDEDYYDSDTLPPKTETDLQETEFIDDEDYFESEPLPTKTETNLENSIDINQILQRYSNVIANKPEHNVEQAGDKNTQSSSVKAKTNKQDNPSAVMAKPGSNLDIKQEKPAVEITMNVNSFALEQETLLSDIATETKKQAKPKTFTCDKCEKQYASNWSLKQHNLTSHTGEKPYKCDECGKQFAVKQYLNQHMKKNHNSIQTDNY